MSSSFFYFFTTTLHVFFLFPLVTVISADPAFFALIKPLEDTVATFLFDDLKEILSTLPASTNAFNRYVFPTFKVTFDLLNLIFVVCTT